MKPALPLVLSLAACATGNVHMDREPAVRSGISLELVAPHDATRVFPGVIEPALPRADRLAHQIHARLGDVVRADLDLCVAPNGDVATAALAASTGFDALDAALVRDASAWKFEAMPGPTGVKSCERARLVYRTPH